MTLTPWLVCSPEYGEVVPVLDDGSGPMEYGCDVVFVEAESRRDALMLGVQLFREKGARYLRYDDEHPYAGVTVESLACKAHGAVAMTFKGDYYECALCGPDAPL